MLEVLNQIRQWRAAGQPVALATLVNTWGSAPRKIGAKMAVTASGAIAGSVSGGCVESAVVAAALEVLEDGRPRLLHFGVADETAWDVGLACGGNIDVFVEVLDDDIFQCVSTTIGQEQVAALATVIGGPEKWLGRRLFVQQPDCVPEDEPEAELVRQAQAAMRARASRRVSLGDSPVDVFVEVYLPPPALIIVGGVQIAIALASFARTLGFRTIVIDPRHAFGSEARFPHVDQLHQRWPQDVLPDIPLNVSTAVALLTHDPKIDDPALEIVLPSAAFYVGALGSRKTHAKRVERLQEAGADPALIERIRGPIGLDINAQTPEEIALAVMAEIVQARKHTVAKSSP